MRADEAGTLARVKALREDVINPKVAEHRGRVVKIMGDGVLVEFPSVLGAVACATQIQRTLAERNAELAEDRRIDLRIGINAGDVIVEGDDLYGDGVNVVARMETLAERGGICISAKVFDEVWCKLELGFADLGGQRVKNIPDPIRAYRVLLDPSAVGTVVAARADAPSIAVLPFENLSAEKRGQRRNGARAEKRGQEKRGQDSLRTACAEHYRHRLVDRFWCHGPRPAAGAGHLCAGFPGSSGSLRGRARALAPACRPR